MRAEIGRRWCCWAVGVLALCSASACYTSNEDGVGGESHFLRPCERDAQCEDLGPEWSCVERRCRMADEVSSSEPDEPGTTGGNGGSGGSSGNDGPAVDLAGALPESSPLVLLVVDTSGSMERVVDCVCTAPGCEECLPDCTQGVRNRFAVTLEVLTGTFDDFACEAIDRTTFGEGTYDFGYYLPYHRPSGTQRTDGLLDEYGDRLRFGLATFDGWDTWVGAPPLVQRDEFDFELSAGQAGLWSYDPAREIPGFIPERPLAIGSFRYPNATATYYMDTGIRSARADTGGLALATDPARAGVVNAEIQRSLLAVRPYGGTPIASSLDDMYHVITKDPRMDAERARGRVPHVVLITDGYPDDDYRTFGCDCSDSTCDGLSMAERDSLACPYPTAEEVAEALRCSPESDCTQIATLHVVALDTPDQTVIDRLNAIAIAGGAPGARFAGSALELRRELDAVLSEIAQ